LAPTDALPLSSLAQVLSYWRLALVVGYWFQEGYWFQALAFQAQVLSYPRLALVVGYWFQALAFQALAFQALVGWW